MGFTFSLSLYNESKNTISLPTKARPTTNANMYLLHPHHQHHQEEEEEE
jgi:hypothetical protein